MFNNWLSKKQKRQKQKQRSAAFASSCGVNVPAMDDCKWPDTMPLSVHLGREAQGCSQASTALWPWPFPCGVWGLHRKQDGSSNKKQRKEKDMDVALLKQAIPGMPQAPSWHHLQTGPSLSGFKPTARGCFLSLQQCGWWREFNSDHNVQD